MNIDRFIRIMEAYGTDEGNWPRDERLAAKQLLQSSDECVAILKSYRSLDALLNDYLPRRPVVSTRQILDSLPRPLVDRIINWLIPGPIENLWRPLMAGSLPLVLGVIIGTSASGEIFSFEASQSAVNWEDEIYLLALDDSAFSTGLDNEQE